MDRTPVSTQSWIAFRFQFYMALITRCYVWSQLNTLAPFTAAAPCVRHRHDAGPASSGPRAGQRPVGSPPDPAAQPARANKAVKLTRASSRPGTGGRPQPASNSPPFALLLRNAAARSTALAQQLSSTQTLFSPPRAHLKPAPGTNSAAALPARSPAPTLRTPPWQPGDHAAQRRRNAVPQVVENCVLPLSNRTRFAQLPGPPPSPASSVQLPKIKPRALARLV